MKLTKNIAKITAAVAGAVALGTFATATTANADSVSRCKVVIPYQVFPIS